MSKSYNELILSPIKGLELASDYKENFQELLKENGDLLYANTNVYDEILNCRLSNVKALRDWLNDVIEYCEENMPKVTFEEAKKHMEDGKKATFQTYDYCFDNDQTLCFINDDGIPEQAIITLCMLNEKAWVLK